MKTISHLPSLLHQCLHRGGRRQFPLLQIEATVALRGIPSLDDECWRKVDKLPKGVQLSNQNLADSPSCSFSLMSGNTTSLSFRSLFASQE
ncbi:unnamed protein product [Brassica oleracea]